MTPHTLRSQRSIYKKMHTEKRTEKVIVSLETTEDYKNLPCS